ncbi:hypothetical protein [Fretibacterium fastidiosum]|uniref:Uncharacterized protein n=1 Tax=Fretibacterium fastidiosum TaxID=651822 RepID=A0AB94IWX3_9BACT|nr:hypothetical protein [Fretibacterium fastidiosum]CBL28263.1 hypothetical protein SY1_10500 [Fretibacterium fastidiosum]
MSKNRIVLFGVLGVVVGLALGVFGRDFIVASEKQKLEAQKAEEEAKIKAMMTGIPVDASQEFIAAKTLVDDMKSLKAMLLIFYMEHIEQEVDLTKTLDTPEHIREVLKKKVRNVEKYLDGNWIFQGNTSDWWIGYNLDDGFKKQASEIGKELVKRAERNGLYKDMNGNLYDGGGKVYMKVH